MKLYALAVFSFCLWAVFSHKFDDGIIVKHLLSLSAILAALVIIDPFNSRAALCGGVLLCVGLAVWAVRKHNQHFTQNRSKL